MWDEIDNDWRREPLPQDFRNELDVRLEMAWQYYTDSCCPKCGTPVWYGRTTDNRVQFDIQDTICYGCETLEKDEADRERRKERKQPGVTKIAVPVGVTYDETGEFEPLPTPWEAMASVPT